MFLRAKKTTPFSRGLGYGMAGVGFMLAGHPNAIARPQSNTHRHAPSHDARAVTPQPVIPPSVTGQDESHLSQADLAKGLPASWRAELLDAPARQASSTVPLTSKATKPLITPGPRPPTESAPPSSSDASNAVSGQVDHILLPIPPQIGIAAFESGDHFIIVVDNAFPMETQAIHGTGFFSSLTVSLLPDATLIQLRRPDTRRLYLSQRSEGWVLSDKPPSSASTQDNHVINPLPVTDGILYPMRRSGRVLTIADPASGDRLLVGTSLLDEGGILAMRRAEGYDVWPTLEGVVIAARDPDISLIAVPSGLLLNRDGQKFEDDGQAVYANDVDLKWLDLQDFPDQLLLKRYHERLLKAADSQPADRFAARLDLARAAISMGAFKEARGILAVALRDDPEEIGRPEVRFLAAATELLTGSPANASALNGPWPEQQRRALQLWRALYLEVTDQSDTRSLHRLALDMNRLRAYPQNLRDVLLPIAAEAIARRGAPGDFAVLDTLPDQPAFRLAKAIAAERQGQKDRAYTAFAALAADRNISVAEKATEEKIALDHERGALTTEQQVKALDELILDARLAGREKQLRLRQAEAYARDKQWQKVAEIIDLGVPQSDPSHYSTLRHALLLQALTGIAGEDSLAQSKTQQLRNAALLKAHIPALPPGEERAALLAAYGETMLALGLSDEATSALSQAIPSLVTPEARAAAGASLAQATLANQKPSDALAALNETESPNLPEPLQTRRNILKARIVIATGDRAKGLDMLRTIPGKDARLLSAQSHESQGEWQSATTELRSLAKEEIPSEGSLTKDQQDLALRLASDASRAGDNASSRWISERIGARTLDESHARLFAVLRESPANDKSLHEDETSP